MPCMPRWWLVFLACFTGSAFAQLNGILLIAKPELVDPNFKETVVLVTRVNDGATVGVVLNRPSSLRLIEVAPNWPGAAEFTQPLYAGGPVMREVVIAVFDSPEEPKAPAFRVLPQIYLSMHPGNL